MEVAGALGVAAFSVEGVGVAALGLLLHFVLLLAVGVLGRVGVLGVVLVVGRGLVLFLAAHDAVGAGRLFDSLFGQFEGAADGFHVVDVAFLESLELLDEFFFRKGQTRKVEVFDETRFSLGARFDFLVADLAQSVHAAAPGASKDFLVKETGSPFFDAHGSHFFADGLARELGVEMATHKVGSPWGLDLHAFDFGPVDVCEELVRSNLFPGLGTVVRVLLEQPPNQVLTRFADGEGEVDLLFLDGLGDFALVVRVKWREAANHLVQQTAQRVEVHGLVVWVPEEHLGTEVLGRAAEGVAVLVASTEFFGKAEVSEFDVARDANQNVLGLQVSVQHVLLVQHFEGLHDLHDVEGRHAFGQFVSLTQEVKQLATHTKVHDEEQFGLVLEGPVEVNDEVGLALALAVDLDFPHNGGRRHAGQQVLLVHYFDCVHLARVLLAGHEHLRVPSFSYQLQEFKIVDGDIGSVPAFLKGLFVGLQNFVVFVRL